MLANMLTGKIVMRAWKGVVRAGRGYNNQSYGWKFLVALQYLTNIELTKYLN